MASWVTGIGALSGFFEAAALGKVFAGYSSSFNMWVFLIALVDLVGAAIFAGAIFNYFGMMLKYRENENNRSEAPTAESLPKI